MLGLLRKNVAIEGHRVLFVNEKGPGGLAGLVPFLDIITHADGVQLNDSDRTLAAVVGKNVDKKTELTVYNLKTRSSRKTHIVSRLAGSVAPVAHPLLACPPAPPCPPRCRCRRPRCRGVAPASWASWRATTPSTPRSAGSR